MPKGQVASRIGAAAAATLVAFIAGKEGLRLTSYLDYGGVPTVCFGETLGIKTGMTFSLSECEEMLDTRVAEAMAGVIKCTRSEIPPGPLASYISFAYNVGTAKFCQSSMAALARVGQFNQSCAQFDRWTYVAGKDCRDPKNLCNGIVIRRTEERAICEGKNHG